MTAIALPSISVARRSGLLPFWAAAAMAVMSGCLLALAMSLQPAWWAAWIGPVPVIAAALASPPGRSRVLGAFAGFLAATSTFSYYAGAAGWPAAVAIVALRTLFWSALVEFAVRTARQLPLPLAMLAPALFAAGADALVLTLSPHGAYGGFAYSQMDLLPVIQLAALGGAPAIVFLVFVAAGAASLALGALIGAELRTAQLLPALAVAIAVVAGGVGYGGLRLAAHEASPVLPVALVTTDRFVQPRDWLKVWRAYGPAVRAAASPGGVVVLPEKIALLSAPAALAAEQQVSDLAQETAATVAVGLEVRGADGVYRNRSLIAAPDGTTNWYDKRRLFLPAERRDRPGRAPLMVRAGGAPTGVAICKDGHYPWLGREYGRAGAALLLIHAWDFKRDGWMSDRLTALRGVESGYAIARATRDGVSSVSDRFGRIVAETSGGQGITVLRTGLALDRLPRPTLYARIGDLFGWTCLGAALLLSGLMRVRRGRARSGA